MDEQENHIELTNFQLRNISLLTHLYENDAVTDEIVELLRQSELDYFSLVEKYKLLEKKINLDEKTNILKFKSDYLTNIIKTASRVYHGIANANYFVSLIRFDIDDFSLFNNKYGHELGDDVLINFASILRENSRPTDYVIRFGGEEFDVLLPSTDLLGAEIFATKIFSRVKDLKIKHNNDTLSVTTSAGISSFIYNFNGKRQIVNEEIDLDYKNLQSEADDALYEAKATGKNRYCIFSQNKKHDYVKLREKYCS